jgi:hypothetical protein
MWSVLHAYRVTETVLPQKVSKLLGADFHRAAIDLHSSNRAKVGCIHVTCAAASI